MTAIAARAMGEEAAVRGLLRGVTVFRAIALAWALIGVTSSREYLRHPRGAIALLALMVGWTALVSLWPHRGPFVPTMATWVIVTELVIGATVLVGDSFVYDPGRGISLPWSWPAAGVMAAGVARGWRAGLGAALAMVAASLFTEFRLDTNLSEPVQAFSRLGLWAVTGLLAGYVSARLRRAEAEVALARAREEVARQLHDGVLQTLAVIQRRSADTELALLAREQESDLRRYLSGSPAEPEALEPGLRRLAQRHEQLFPDTTVTVVVAPDAPPLGRTALEAVLGAAGEALTNAGKHAAATKVTIYAEPAEPDELELLPDGHELRRRSGRGAGDGVLFLSVKDNGRGFDPTTADEGIGLSRSIRGRIVEAGGVVDIASRPGRGTEVRLWIEG